MPRTKLTAMPNRPDGERDAAAVEHAREQVAAQAVRAPEEHGAALGRADQVQVALPLTPEPVLVAAAEETQRLRLRRIGLVDPFEGLHVEPVAVAQHVRADEPPLVEQVDRLRRRVDELGVARGRGVGRQELDDDDGAIEQQQDRGRDHGQMMLPELPPHQPPLRGGVKAFLLGGEDVDIVGIERGGIDVARR